MASNNGEGDRFIDHVILKDVLDKFSRMGIEVPAIKSSDIPAVFKDRNDGVVIYQQGDKTLEVGQGHIIDSYGNVVNISALENKAYALIPTNEIAAQYFKMYTPIPKNGESKIKNYFQKLIH